MERPTLLWQSGPLAQALSYGLRCQLPEWPHVIPDGFGSSGGGRIGESFPQSPRSVPRAQPVALMLWFSKKRGADLPHHGIVSSLASDPHLGGDCAQFQAALGTVVFPLMVPDMRHPWSPRQSLEGFNQTMFLWPHAVPSQLWSPHNHMESFSLSLAP